MPNVRPKLLVEGPTPLRPRGRPQTGDATLLDLTAVASDLPPWDASERALLSDVYRRVRFIAANTNDPALVLSQARIVEHHLQRWSAGDARENAKHTRLFDGLRLVNGQREAAGHGPKTAA